MSIIDLTEWRATSCGERLAAIVLEVKAA